MTDVDPHRGPRALAEQFVALNDYLSAGGDRETALRRLVTLSARSVPGCDWASVVAWPLDREPRTLASSDDVLAPVDRVQYALGEGPGLTAACGGEAVLAPDLSHEQRWPRFAATAVSRTPVRSAVCLHVADRPQRSALNLYGRCAGAFDDEAFALATLVASHARVVLSHAACADKAANLEQALTTSRQIGISIGILMKTHRITDDEAFVLLRTCSQHLHRKLRDVAEEVGRTGVLPRALPGRRPAAAAGS